MRFYAKLIAILLAITLLVTTFVGCKDKKEEENTISVLLLENPGRVQEDQSTPVTKSLEEKFGIKFKFITAPSHDEIAVTLGRYASRNEIPDLVITQTIELNKYQKFCVNLKDYRSAMADMYKFIDEQAVSQQVLSKDGSFYIAPTIYETQIYVAYMIRTDWLENLGYDEGWVPNTLDEFDEVMHAFANDDPNMDGAATKELGFHPMDAGWLREYAMNFGVSPDYYIKDGHVVYGPLQPEYKEAIQYLNGLYKDGVLDPEFITGDMEDFKERISTGKVGFTRSYFNRIEDAIAWSRIGDPDAKWQIILPPLNEKTGKRYEQRYTTRVGNMGIAINRRVSDSKKDKLISLINYLYSDEGRLLTSFGVEGETYDMVDGKPTFKDVVINNPRWKDSLTKKYYYGIEPAAHFAMVQDKDSFIYAPEVMVGVELYEANASMFQNLIQAPPVTLNMNYEDSEREAATYDWYVVQEKEMAGTYEFIRGKRSFNEWDSFMAELKTYGIDACMQIIDSAYQRVMNKK